MLKVGTPAPTFVAESTKGTIRLQDFFGKNSIILFFYPGDNTPICTKQLAEAQAASEEFSRLDTVMIGVNQGSVESHQKFAEEQGYAFPLVADPDRKISTLYDLEMMKEYPDFVERAVFVIDPDGVIRFAVAGNPSTTELLDALEQTV